MCLVHCINIVCLNICLCLCMFVSQNTHTHIYIYIHTHTHTQTRVYLVFDNVPKADALLGKLQEFQAALTNSDESSLALTDTSALTSLVQRYDV